MNTTTTDTERAPRKSRNVRVEDALWDAAQAEARCRGEHVSEVIRDALNRYVGRCAA